jgi:hypothetical protein
LKEKEAASHELRAAREVRWTVINAIAGLLLQAKEPVGSPAISISSKLEANN